MHQNERIVGLLLGCILLLVALQAMLPQTYVSRPKVVQPEEVCVGDPLAVDFAYTGGVNEPWTCKVQCDDKRQRYILYTNGKATQCELLPGCNDHGEDFGITCSVPGMKSVVQ